MNAIFESKLFKQILPIILLAGVLYAAVLATMLYRAPSARIGYIDSKTITQKYPPAVNAQKAYDQRTEDLKQKNQAYQMELEKIQQDYSANHAKWDRAKIAAKEMEFRQKQENYARFAQSANAAAQQLQQELLQPVFTELRTKIAEFGKAQKYSLILEMTDGGTVLYGDKGTDVTEEFITYAQSKK